MCPFCCQILAAFEETPAVPPEVSLFTTNTLMTHLLGTVQHFGKYAYLLSGKN